MEPPPPTEELYVSLHEAAATPRGVVVIVHGYAEHCGRYDQLVAAFGAAGFHTLRYDQRGFGRSPGRPALVAETEALVADLGRMVKRAESQWPGLPLVVFGHSMGGLVATLFGLESDRLAGLILSSPLLQSDQAPLLQRVGRVLGRIAPRMPTIKLDRTGLSRRLDVVQQAEQDPLNYHGRMPARTGAEFLRGMRLARGGAHRIGVPLLVMHGTADPIAHPEGSSMLYSRVRAEHKQLLLFEGAYHETFNDLEGQRVIDQLVDWLEDLASARGY